MIPKSGYRFSEKIMLKQRGRADDDSTRSHRALLSRFFTAVHGGARLRRERAGTSRAGARSMVEPGDWVMIRMLLVLAVIALGADALLNNGGYTQAAGHRPQTRKLEPTKDGPAAQKPS